jgi:phthalate 4,5-dioxygenase
VGFLAERCPHRGTSLALARNEECGLRCIFHGWKIDVSGKVVDVPTHSPSPEAFAAKVPVGHYPTHEGGGIIWVWLGAQEAPPFPELPFTVMPASQVWMTITKCYCNWLQGVEATIDSAHVGTLHMAYVNRDQANVPMTHALDALAPRYEVAHTPYGLDAAALRPLDDGSTYVRTTKYIMPFISFTPGGYEVPAVIFIVSPIDDTHHNLFYGAWSNHAGFNNGDGVPEEMSTVVGDLPYDPHNFGGFTSDHEHNYGQAREAMKKGHFSGFVGNLLQEDTVTQASMGPIVDRTRDHLSSSDVAIIHSQHPFGGSCRRGGRAHTPGGTSGHGPPRRRSRQRAQASGDWRFRSDNRLLRLRQVAEESGDRRRLSLRCDVPVGVSDQPLDPRGSAPAGHPSQLEILLVGRGEPGARQEASVGAALVLRLVDAACGGDAAPK